MNPQKLFQEKPYEEIALKKTVTFNENFDESIY